MQIMLKRGSTGKDIRLTLKESRVTSLNRDFTKVPAPHFSQLQNGNNNKNNESIGRQGLDHRMPLIFFMSCFDCWHISVLLRCEVFIHVSLTLAECLAQKHSTVFDKWLNDGRVNSLEIPIHFRSVTL